MAKEGGFVNKIRALAAPPTSLRHRFIYAVDDALLTVISYKGAQLLANYHDGKSIAARTLNNPVSDMITNAQTMEQLELIAGIQNNVGIMINQLKISEDLFYASLGLATLAAITCTYNSIAWALEFTQNLNNQ